MTMCGGGGGGGAAGTSICHNANYVIFQGAGGGGSGGKIEDKLIQIEDIDIISVYVGGGGTGEVVGSAPENTKPPSIVIWDPCADSLETNNTLCDSLVKYADAGNSGGNGGKTQGLVYQWRAGHGGELAGGSGGIYLGNCGLAGGGGGGGGATRFGIYGEKHYNLVGGGGGGAGEGLRAQLDSTPTIKYNGAPGGGGGGALYISAIDRVKRGGDGGYGKELDRGCNAGGGKGGAPSGNNGEQSGCNVGSGYLDKLVATSGKGGDSPLSNYPNNCAGGHGEGYNYSFDSRLYSDNTYWQKTNPRPNGLNGIIELKYISGNLGGQGGDSGRKITKNISVNEGDTIKIIVGNGGEGGKTSYLDSNGNIVDEQTPQSGEATVVYINSIENFSTDDENSEFVNGQVSDDKDGGSGAKDLNMNCYAGAGGNNSSIKGKNATGYGGCGGGGGYIASDGGRGAGGYAKITY
ncbi:MAG: hypothetical protein IJW73_07305 [Candidatus Gastranaerophilales bacterium]|nr:hypothetical protein [Candidatus Gastranaerophilales bacterium]